MTIMSSVCISYAQSTLTQNALSGQLLRLTHYGHPYFSMSPPFFLAGNASPVRVATGSIIESSIVPPLPSPATSSQKRKAGSSTTTQLSKRPRRSTKEQSGVSS